MMCYQIDASSRVCVNAREERKDLRFVGLERRLHARDRAGELAHAHDAVAAGIEDRKRLRNRIQSKGRAPLRERNP